MRPRWSWGLARRRYGPPRGHAASGLKSGTFDAQETDAGAGNELSGIAGEEQRPCIGQLPIDWHPAAAQHLLSRGVSSEFGPRAAHGLFIHIVDTRVFADLIFESSLVLVMLESENLLAVKAYASVLLSQKYPAVAAASDGAAGRGFDIHDQDEIVLLWAVPD